jgi:hypothetical protein
VSATGRDEYREENPAAVIKTIAVCAGLVFLFDNKITGDAGTVLLASIAVPFACGLIWLVFRLSEDSGYWPKKPDE